jgi:hypothetical protein
MKVPMGSQINQLKFIDANFSAVPLKAEKLQLPKRALQKMDLFSCSIVDIVWLYLLLIFAFSCF